MDGPIIEDATFVAQAYQANNKWHVFVREWFAGATSVVNEPDPVWVQTGFACEAWAPLTDTGWVVSSPEVHDGIGMSVAVSPPVDTVHAPVTDGREHVFVRRLAARRVPSMAAMRLWRCGWRDAAAAAAHYHRQAGMRVIGRLSMSRPRTMW